MAFSAAFSVAPSVAPSAGRPPAPGHTSGSTCERRPGASATECIHGHAHFLRAMEASQDSLVVVKFYAKWCRACRAVGTKLNKIAVEFPQCRFYDMEFDENRDLCRQLGVTHLPTLHFYSGSAGRVEDFRVGASRVAIVRQKLQTYLAASCDLSDKDAPHFQL